MPALSLKLAVFWIITFGLLLGLWFLYTSTLSISELLVGAGASALAATGTAVVEGQRFAKFSPGAAWLRLFARTPVDIIRDTAVLWWAGLSAIFGRSPTPQMQAFYFQAGGDDQRSSARRALAIVLVTIPPNTIVIGIDRHQNLALVHFLVPAPEPAVLRRLGVSA